MPKRKSDDGVPDRPSKRVCHTQQIFSTQAFQPKGFKWNADTYSCAYDSVFSVLLGIHHEHRQLWHNRITHQNIYLHEFSWILADVLLNAKPLEDVHDAVRRMLHQADPDTFPVTGHDGTDLYAVCREIFAHEGNIISEHTQCHRCNYIIHTEMTRMHLFTCTPDLWQNAFKSNGPHANCTLIQWLKVLLYQKYEGRCTTCRAKLVCKMDIVSAPNFLVFNVYKGQVKLQKKIAIVTVEGQTKEYRLCGLVYFGGFHFTCRIIASNGKIWYHDGQETEGSCILEDKVLGLN